MEYRFKTNDKIKNYEVLKPIGKGSYGQVYLVKWTTSEGEKQGALKILEENAKLSSIINEVFNWGKLTNHSNILTLIHPDTCNGQVLLVSEYVKDGSLEDWFENNHQKPKFVNETVELMFGALNGLEHLHINKVLHRDIKPSNILLNGKNPLLADFGLAIDLEIEQSSNIGGTLRYLSPKLMNVHLNLGVKKVSYKRTVQDDLWAIGLTFYELLTGEIPFSFSDEIRDCAPNKFSLKLPKDFHSFFRKAFSKVESDRFQTVSQMKSALKICWEKLQAKVTLQAKETIEDNSWLERNQPKKPENMSGQSRKLKVRDFNPITNRSNRDRDLWNDFISIGVGVLILFFGWGIYSFIDFASVTSYLGNLVSSNQSVQNDNTPANKAFGNTNSTLSSKVNSNSNKSGNGATTSNVNSISQEMISNTAENKVEENLERKQITNEEQKQRKPEDDEKKKQEAIIKDANDAIQVAKNYLETKLKCGNYFYLVDKKEPKIYKFSNWIFFNPSETQSGELQGTSRENLFFVSFKTKSLQFFKNGKELKTYDELPFVIFLTKESGSWIMADLGNLKSPNCSEMP